VTTLTITVHAPCEWINSNHRVHRMEQARRTKLWRAAGARAAHNAPPFTGPVQVTATIYKARGGRYDPGNLYPTAKACIDGIVSDAGLLPDDSHEWLQGPDMRHGGKGDPRLEITITPL
jgi:crossover junction endodeoxyribonuclease RusA